MHLTLDSKNSAALCGLVVRLLYLTYRTKAVYRDQMLPVTTSYAAWDVELGPLRLMCVCSAVVLKQTCLQACNEWKRIDLPRYQDKP